MAAGEAFVVQKFAEPGRRLFPRHLIELRQDENAFREHAFRQIGLAFPGLHLGHELRGALELLLVIGDPNTAQAPFRAYKRRNCQPLISKRFVAAHVALTGHG